MLATKTTVQIADLAAEPMYAEERDPSFVAAVELGGIRTLLDVPMLKENELIGAIQLYRQVVRRSLISRSRWCRISLPRP